ncbi:MAG: alpha/beta hydrolase [Bacteroidota bacterium]|nr:alpha/beta hydrolase [Rhodothermia bacterium]MDW8286401.1 alpha/beta hydrolase [Bacteroidota bacterium]
MMARAAIALLIWGLLGCAGPKSVRVDPRMLADAEGFFLSTGRFRLYVRPAGPEHGEPVLLVHGFGGSTVSFEPLLDSLAARGYRCYAVDLLGFGLSDKPNGADYSHPAQARRLVALLDELGLKAVHAVGHSMGGSVLAHLALLAPDRIRSLALIAPAIATEPRGPAGIGRLILGLPPVSTLLKRRIRESLSGPEAMAALRLAYYQPDSALSAERLERYRRPLKTPGWESALLGMLRDSRRNALAPERLRGVRAPVLLLWGEADRIVPIRERDRLRELFPVVYEATIRRTGHLPAEEAPGLVARALIAFWTFLSE